MAVAPSFGTPARLGAKQSRYQTREFLRDLANWLHKNADLNEPADEPEQLMQPWGIETHFTIRYFVEGEDGYYLVHRINDSVRWIYDEAIETLHTL